jgi:hypothetical protein
MGFLDEDKETAMQQLRFLGEQRPAIISEFFRNASKRGYVFLSASSDFKSTEAPRFIQRDFDESKFVNYLEQVPQPEASDAAPMAGNARWVYYEIYWQHNNTSWHLKEAAHPAGTNGLV